MYRFFLILFITSTKIMFCQQETIDSIIGNGGCVYQEQMPEFVGGNDSLGKFITKNFNVSVDNNYSKGKIYISFVVAEDGTLNDIKVLKGLSDKLDKEAIRVFSIMPKWKPVKRNGKPCRVVFNYPIKIG
jgi:hypothetical protein